MDGSYLRLWGDPGQNGNGELVGEARINLFAKTLEVMSCAQVNCNTAGETAAQRGARTLYITNGYANIALGYGKSQPLRLRSSADGQFVLELHHARQEIHEQLIDVQFIVKEHEPGRAIRLVEVPHLCDNALG